MQVVTASLMSQTQQEESVVLYGSAQYEKRFNDAYTRVARYFDEAHSNTITELYVWGQECLMNPWLKEDWIQSLTSNDYRRATGGLCFRDKVCGYSFCCLGVLGDRVSPFQWADRPLDGGGQFAFIWRDSPYRHLSELPASLFNPLLGCDAEAGESIQGALARLNDSFGTDFKLVAEAISYCIRTDPNY